MMRSAKILALVFTLILAAATSIYAYAQSTSSAGNKVAAPQETTQVNAQDAAGSNAQVKADDEEAVESQEVAESEVETKDAEPEESEAAESANDPVEAPGTPGYEEGNFDGQHEFK